MRERIYLSRPDISELEVEFVVAALRAGWVAPAGPDLTAFEQEVAARAGTAHAVAVSSGTAALHLALLGLGIGREHAVIVPTLTFAATANAVVYTGATPVFVDCTPWTGNLDVNATERALVKLGAAGQNVGAIIAVDLFGSCADYTALTDVAHAFGVPLVEDAAEALGSSHAGRSAGSFGRVSVFSFNGNKVITTSGGGMLLSDDADLVARARYLATQARQPVEHYEHTEIGYNYRLSNVLAALGRAQLRRLDSMLARRRRLRELYAKFFAGVPGVRLLAEDDAGSNCWLTTVVVDPRQAGWRSADLADHLRARDIESRPVWKPMHLQPVFAAATAVLTGAAEYLFDCGLVLPSGSAIDEAQAQRVVDSIEEFLVTRR
jgi:dTDP-4-amino-4,6-dideoxygalactose transaminase